MRSEIGKPTLVLVVAAVATSLTLAPSPARAHCDTLDGPVVQDARAALEARQVTPILKWVKADREAEVRRAFEQTLQVRGLGPEAQALADQFFFETIVRLHRDGEGAPYTGLKPAGTPVDAGIAASDRSLATGAVEPLVELVSRRIDRGLRQRHAQAVEARTRVDESVERGRHYVAAYVDLMHYAEQLLDAASAAPHSPDPEHSH
jgi:hypothetical protein